MGETPAVFDCPAQGTELYSDGLSQHDVEQGHPLGVPLNAAERHNVSAVKKVEAKKGC